MECGSEGTGKGKGVKMITCVRGAQQERAASRGWLSLRSGTEPGFGKVDKLASSQLSCAGPA